MTPKRTAAKSKAEHITTTSNTSSTTASKPKKSRQTKGSSAATTKKATKKPRTKTTTQSKTAKSQTRPKSKNADSSSNNTKGISASKRFAVIRVRGINNVRRQINDTLSLMNLKRINNLTFVDDRPSYRGMLQKSKDYVTWGEPDVDVVTSLFQKWGKVTGDHPLTDSYVKQHSNYKSIKEFVTQFLALKAELSDIKGLKPFFRLHPPKGGHKGRGIKYAFAAHGSLGYRGENINDLIKRMAGI